MATSPKFRTPRSSPAAKPRTAGRKPATAAETTAAPLATYRQKRDFTQSPEPKGATVRIRTTQHFFCIQKHLASHLHYDFRLEHRGVLLSWAVPKGPSTDPATKRLAMQVEDHPREYGTFEGVIPSGYGAGIVLLWDRGIWQPLVDDVDAALERGNLPFVVVSEKLKGAWTLIRASRVGPKAWLLVKQRDEWASSEDVTTAQPRSVASDGDFADVLAAQARDPWKDGAPTTGGETGALFRKILTRAAELRGNRPPSRRRAASHPTGLS